MLFLRTPISRQWAARASAALLCAGLTTTGGCTLQLAPADRTAASTESSETGSAATSHSLARLLARTRSDAEPPGESARGRLFAAVVDRFPSRETAAPDPFLKEQSAHPDTTATLAARKRSGAAAGHEAEAGYAVARLQDAATGDTRRELWDAFESDVAAAPGAPSMASLLAHRGSLNEKPADSDVPNWARPAVPQTGSRFATAHSPTAAALLDAIPVRRASDVEQVAGTDLDGAFDRSDDHAARLEMQRLMALARQHEQQGALRRAHQSALEALAIAERNQLVFTRHEEQPSDLLERLESRLMTPEYDPFGDLPARGLTQPAREGASPFLSAGAGRSSFAAAPQPGPIGTQAAAAPSEGDSGISSGHSGTSRLAGFPEAPEWRSVQSNSAVSLAVVEQAAPLDTPGPTVQHAVVVGPAPGAEVPGRFPRSPAEGRNFMGQSEDPMFLAAREAGRAGMNLSPPEVRALAVSPAPPLTADVTARAADEPAEEQPRTGGFGRWILGGLLLVAGLWAFLIREKPSTRPVEAGASRRSSTRPLAKGRAD